MRTSICIPTYVIDTSSWLDYTAIAEPHVELELVARSSLSWANHVWGYALRFCASEILNPV